MTVQLRERIRSEAGFSLAELLVVIVLTSIIATAITAAVVSTFRVEETERALQDVIDDGRIAMTDVRRELRAARRIDEGSDASNLHFWVDQNQDSLSQPEELICYSVSPLSTTPPRFEVVRVRDVPIGDCNQTNLASGYPDRRTLARTLVNDVPFIDYQPPLAGISEPETREVTIRFVLETLSPRGPGETTVEGAVRLRNVP